jgi:ketosteroid isomerase-like protein
MNTRFWSIILCLLSVSIAEGQSWQKDIGKSIESLNKAMIFQDKNLLEKLTADALSYGHSTGLIENKKQFINNVISGPVKFLTIIDSTQTMVRSGNIAIVRYVSHINGNKNGEPLDIKIGILMIWEKQGVDWKLLARQGFKF